MMEKQTRIRFSGRDPGLGTFSGPCTCLSCLSCAFPRESKQADIHLGEVLGGWAWLEETALIFRSRGTEMFEEASRWI